MQVQELQRDITQRKCMAKKAKVFDLKGLCSTMDKLIQEHGQSIDEQRVLLEKVLIIIVITEYNLDGHSLSLIYWLQIYWLLFSIGTRLINVYQTSRNSTKVGSNLVLKYIDLNFFHMHWHPRIIWDFPFCLLAQINDAMRIKTESDRLKRIFKASGSFSLNRSTYYVRKYHQSEQSYHSPLFVICLRTK